MHEPVATTEHDYLRQMEFEDELRAQRIAAGNKNMLIGALWCIGGIAVTVMTYSAASGGGRYVVAWGAIIFGAIQFFKGMAQRSGN